MNEDLGGRGIVRGKRSCKGSELKMKRYCEERWDVVFV